jgi:hypothetical protein
LRSSPAQYGANLREIVMLTRAAGAQPILLSFWGENSPQRERTAALDATARELNVPLITYAGPRLDVVHPSREGYVALAEQVRRRLGELGVLSP